ncbi:MAG: carboxypeptidase-like regulatory domain-containing protein, partial [Bacteroidota bacterium]
MLRIKFVIIIILAAFVQVLKAQDIELAQISGVVISQDTAHMPIPFASVYNKNLRLGTYSNVDGFYTIIAHPGDTIMVTCLGYIDQKFTIP